MNFALIYNVNTYPDLGGGMHHEQFETLNLMTEAVNKLSNDHGSEFEIVAAYEIREQITYKPVTRVTKLEPDI